MTPATDCQAREPRVKTTRRRRARGRVIGHAVTGALRPRETRLLSADRWSISAIVLWELAKRAQMGQISVDLDDPDVVRALARIQVWPLTREVARALPCAANCRARRSSVVSQAR